MKITKTVYVCDICNQEVEKVTLTPMPIQESDSEGRIYYNKIRSVDMCDDCKEIYINTVFANFGIVRDTLGKLSFTPSKKEKI